MNSKTKTELSYEKKKKIRDYLDDKLSQNSLDVFDLTFEGISKNVKYTKDEVEGILDELEDEEEIVELKKLKLDLYATSEYKDKLKKYDNFKRIDWMLLFGVLLFSVTLIVLKELRLFTIASYDINFVILMLSVLAFWYYVIAEKSFKFGNDIGQKISSSLNIDKGALITVVFFILIFFIGYYLIAQYLKEPLSAIGIITVIGVGIAAGAFVWPFILKNKK